jgi:hypothetical protein
MDQRVFAEGGGFLVEFGRDFQACGERGAGLGLEGIWGVGGFIVCDNGS